jgi:hypothetical protein
MPSWVDDECCPRPDWARREGLEGSQVYRGRSMGTGFSPGDLLYLRKVSLAQLEVGDVVVFRRGEEKQVVHRVVGRALGGLVTRGDAVLCDDPDPVTPEDLLGRVEWKARGRSRCRIRGGVGGRRRHRSQQFRAHLISLLKSPFVPIYRKLRVSRKINRLLLFRIIKPRLTVAGFFRGDRVVIKVLYKGHTIVTLEPDRLGARVKKPYDLMLGTYAERLRLNRFRVPFADALRREQALLKTLMLANGATREALSGHLEQKMPTVEVGVKLDSGRCLSDRRLLDG